MKINTAEFVISNSEVSKCPNEPLPEYAFIGRSNVGKSSLINMLTNNKNLAKTSGRPGKTQLINHFKINLNWFLVDLPGYGYARVSKKTKEVFQKFITYLGETEVPFCIVFTKVDKIGKVKAQQNVAAYTKKILANNWAEMPQYFITSSTDKTGREEILTYIDEINQVVFKENDSFI